MKKNPWEMYVSAYDERRDLIVAGAPQHTIAFAVEQFVAIANASITARDMFVVALSGGNTPKAIFELLIQKPYCDAINWNKVYVFWSDERNVPADHSDSNYRMAMQSGWNKLSIPPSQIFRMPADENIEMAALEYEAAILSVVPDAVFDLIMLGMGDDGHTASLFPHTAALRDDQHLVAANYIPQKTTWRMTLTYKCINKARHIVIYVLGANKASMVSRALTAPSTPEELPIQNIGTASHKALWLLDDAAAEGLQNVSIRH